MEIKSGVQTSFWFDHWSGNGSIHELLGGRGFIYMGLPREASVADTIVHRPWRHRSEMLNEVEEEINKVRNRGVGIDVALWRGADGKFKPRFSSNETWQQVRHVGQLSDGSKGIWFSGSTPKYSFLLWLTSLNRLTTIILHHMSVYPVYLWTVPMFHCNRWCLLWGVAAQGGTNICLRKVSPKLIFKNIAMHNVTHMGGAPTVLNMIVNSPVIGHKPLPHRVEVMTGGSPPLPQVLAKMEELGFNVCHLYGLTETYGPGSYCVWKPEWDSLSLEERTKLKSRQRMQHLGLDGLEVKDPVTMKTVPNDGLTMGEVMFRGNTAMSGYFKDLEATRKAFEGDWCHSGDLAVKHPDGYIEVKDRLKDVIILGGENISTVEVERVLSSHQAVLDAAVVARPDNHWGQTPCGFVTLKDGFDTIKPEEIIKFCRDHLAHYMSPKTIVFRDLPKTSTGKVKKYLLRKRANEMGSL